MAKSPPRAAIALVLRRARRGIDNRAVDIAVGVANSAGRPLVVYVETSPNAAPAWLVELATSLGGRAIGLLVGTEATREVVLGALAPFALLYEAGEPAPSGFPSMPLDIMSTEALVSADSLPTAFWEKVGRAADYALPRGAIVPTAWCEPPQLPPLPDGRELPTPSTSHSAAEASLRALVIELDEGKVADVIAAIEAGMLPLERAVQAILDVVAPRDRQEAVLRALSPGLRAS